MVEMKTGVMNDGKLVARQIRIIWDTGAYADCAPLLCRNASYSAAGPYFIPNQKVDGYCVYTNKNIGAAYRGFGLVEMSWAYETHTDAVAERLGIDPLEIRLKNVLEEGSISGTGQILHSVGLKECLKIVAERIGWNKEKVKKNRGKGIACAHKASHAPTGSSAAVRINNDGSVTVMAGTTDLGQDPRTIFAEIVSEELGVPLERISVSFPDTDYTPWDRSTSSSRGTFHMGNAVRLAAADAKKQLFELAFDFFGGDAQNLDTRDSRVFIGSDPNRAVTFRELIAVRPKIKGGPIMGRGVYYPTDATGLDLETGQGGRVTAFWMYGAQAAEVEVDEETGQVNVVRVVAAHDVGKAINPIRVEGQIEGGVLMGVGSALMEEAFIEDGRTVNCNLVNYKVPTSLDAPEIEAIIVEEPHRDGPYGAKGIGEAPATPTGPAIGNAVFDAVGVRIKDLPITAEKVFWALRKKSNHA
jgi:CO/xanthine dehydrogenase Mo-binding subunit